MDKFKSIKVASILGIIGNVFLFILKGIVGFMTGSYAMLSETFNSAGDIFSSLMTYVGNKIAGKKADDDHNLGHGKAEYIFSLLISVMMIVVSLDLIYSSIKSLALKEPYTFSIYLIVISSITFFTKLSLFIYTHRIAGKYKSILIEANASDHRNDCVLALMTLTSSVLGLYNIYFVDGIVGMLVSLWILITGLKIFKESFDVLMDKGMDDEAREEVLKIVAKYPEIKKVNHFNSTPIGYQYQISITIFVDGNLSTFESHEIANKLEKELMKHDKVYLAVIHVNPL